MSDLAVVICTHNRLGELRECLESLTQQALVTEAVVVDSAPEKPCEELVRSFEPRIGGLRYCCVDEPGLSLARNAGLLATTAEIVAFIDDDAVALPGWDRAMLDCFAEHPGAGCVGGACNPRFDGVRPAWLSARLLQLASITRWGDEPRRPRSSAEWPFGANMAFRRAALERVGAFSLALGRKGSGSLLSGEDSDMVRRVLTAGWEVWLEPRAAVLHKVHSERLTSRFYWRRFWWGGVSRAQSPSLRVSARLAIAVPIRAGAWVVTRDRIFVYRLAESAGYFVTAARRPLARIRSSQGS